LNDERGEGEMMQSTEGFVTTSGGVRLFYERAGHGEKSIIVPNGIYLFDDFRHLAKGRTLIAYDVRNRGRSDLVVEGSKLIGDLAHDVEDLEALRRHFGFDEVSLIGHSYIGMLVVLYAKKYPAQVGRVIQIGPVQPDAEKRYPPHLMCADAVLQDAMSKMQALQQERAFLDPAELCRRMWAVLRPIYVADAAQADKIKWDRCELPNESGFMRYWAENLLPSIRATRLTEADVAAVSMPDLIIHGTMDRSAPYGGGRDWAMLLPNAKLISVDNVAHAPWIEAPDRVFGSIESFLDGAWPAVAERITAS
jgi:proline iminopeptidase